MLPLNLSEQDEVSPHHMGVSLLQLVEEHHSTSQILSESTLFFKIQAPSLDCVGSDMDWKDLMLLVEQDDKTPHPLSVNDAIYHINTGHKNTIKGDPNTQCSIGLYAQTSRSLMTINHDK